MWSQVLKLLKTHKESRFDVASYPSPPLIIAMRLRQDIGPADRADSGVGWYRVSGHLTLDGSVQQLLPVGTGFLGIGAEAFYLQQHPLCCTS
jgi:hypothetical protein